MIKKIIPIILLVAFLCQAAGWAGYDYLRPVAHAQRIKNSQRNTPVNKFKNILYRAALEEARGNVSKAARLLGVSRSTLIWAIIQGRVPGSITESERQLCYENEEIIPARNAEAILFRAAMLLTRGNQARSARLLGVTRNTLRTYLDKQIPPVNLDIDRAANLMKAMFDRNSILANGNGKGPLSHAIDIADSAMYPFMLALRMDIAEGEENLNLDVVTFIDWIEEAKLRQLSDAALREKTRELKAEFESGTSLNEILPEAYAVFREAARRSAGMHPTPEQVLASISIHKGRAVEMLPGEGKTLSIAMAAYLNALAGKGVHVHTFNDFLAVRDCKNMGAIFMFLGLTTGALTEGHSYVFAGRMKVNGQSGPVKECSKKEAYNCDITFGIKDEFIFDYMRDDMVHDPSARVQRAGFPEIIIVDEADSIMIDEGYNPLIIGKPVSTHVSKLCREIYAFADDLLKPEEDYSVDYRSRWVELNEHGKAKTQGFFFRRASHRHIISDNEQDNLIRQALSAKWFYKKNEHYVKRNNRVIIVDEFTGRCTLGRVWGNHIHQFVEAKEKVRVSPDFETSAIMTYQGYYNRMRRVCKLSAVSGTIWEDEAELREVYGLITVGIPSQKIAQRIDMPPVVYKTAKEKDTKVLERIQELQEIGNPVLVFVPTIKETKRLEQLLAEKGIRCNVMDGQDPEKEDPTISKMGGLKEVTVATNAAGRGIHISVSQGAGPLGGLVVIRTFFNTVRRADSQQKTRTARRGEKGWTETYVSKEDEIFIRFGQSEPQKSSELYYKQLRMRTISYDEELEPKRRDYYRLRNMMLHFPAPADFKKERLVDMDELWVEYLTAIQDAQYVMSFEEYREFSSVQFSRLRASIVNGEVGLRRYFPWLEVPIEPAQGASVAAAGSVLRPRAAVQRAVVDLPANLERIKTMSRDEFYRLSPAEQDRELLFLEAVRENLLPLSRDAEQELARLFSPGLLRRMLHGYLDDSHLDAALDIMNFYGTYKRFESDRDTMRYIGRELTRAPLVKAVYGVGYPFYGDIDMPRAIFLILLRLAEGRITQDEFIRRILPDADMIVVFEPIEPVMTSPRKVQKGMSGLLFRNFVEEIHPFRRNWKELLDGLYEKANVADGIVEKSDPVKDFSTGRRCIHLDMTPCREYVWRNLPVFVMDEDSKYFEWLIDFFFTGDPITNNGPAMNGDDVPALFCRNFLLRILEKPLTQEEILDRIFAAHAGRLHMHLFSQARDLGKQRLGQAVSSALETGLINVGKNNRLYRTAMGTEFIKEVIEQRAILLRDGLDPSRPGYEDWKLMLRAEQRKEDLEIRDAQLRRELEASILRPRAARERQLGETMYLHEMASMTDEELIGYAQSTMTLYINSDNAILFKEALRELKRRGWRYAFVIIADKDLSAPVCREEPFADYTGITLMRDHISEPGRAVRGLNTLLKILAPEMFSNTVEISEEEEKFIRTFLDHSAINFLQHARSDTCMFLLRFDHNVITRVVALNREAPFYSGHYHPGAPLISIRNAVKPYGHYGSGGYMGTGLNYAVDKSHFFRLETHHEKGGFVINDDVRNLRSPYRIKEEYFYDGPTVPYVYGVILDAVHIGPESNYAARRKIIDDDKRRIKALTSSILRPRAAADRNKQAIAAAPNGQNGKTDDSRTLREIDQKELADLTDRDLASVQRIASNAVSALLSDPACRDRMRQLNIESFVKRGNVLFAPEEALIQIARAFREKDSTETRIFGQALGAAYRIINHKRLGKTTRRARLNASEHCRTLCLARLVFEPGSNMILGEYAHSLAHLGRYEEAEAILVELQQQGDGSRYNIVNLGYVRLELARNLKDERLTPALQHRRFEEALMVIEDMKRLLGHAQTQFFQVALPYVKGRDSNLVQVPRALSGLSLVNSLLSEAYLAVENTRGFARPRNYGLLALKYSAQSLEYGLKAVTARTDGDPNFNPHSIGVLNRAVSLSAIVIGNFLSNGEMPPFSFEEFEQPVDRSLKALKSVAELNINTPARSLMGLIAIKVMPRFGLYREVSVLVKERLVEQAKSARLSPDFTKSLNDDVTARVTGGYPAVETKACVGRFITALDLDQFDLDMIYIYFNLDNNGRSAKIIAGYTGSADPAKIEQRFSKIAYRFLGLELVRDAVLTVPDEEKARTDTQPDTTVYDNAFITQLSEGADIRRLEVLEDEAKRLDPWLSPPQRAAISNSLGAIRLQMEEVIGKCNEVLAAGKKSDKKHPQKKHKNGVSSTAPSNPEVVRRDITILRAGADKKGGYRATLRQLEARLINRKREAAQAINASAAAMRQYTTAASAYQQNFHFQWLDSVVEDLHRIESEIIRLKDPANESYLDHDRLLDLEREAAAVFGQTGLIKHNMPMLRTIGNGLSQAREALSEFAKSCDNGSEHRFDDLRDEAEDRLAALEEEFYSLVFTQDFEAQRASIAAGSEEFISRTGKLGGLVDRYNKLEKRFNKTTALIRVCGGSLAKESPLLTEFSAVAAEPLDAIGAAILTYDDCSSFETALSSREESMYEGLDRLDVKAGALYRDKRQRILREVQYIETALNRIRQDMEARVAAGYEGSPSSMVAVEEYFDGFGQVIGRMQDLLKSDACNEGLAQEYISSIFGNFYLYSKYFLPDLLNSEIDKLLNKYRKEIYASIIEKYQKETSVHYEFIIEVNSHGYPVGCEVRLSGIPEMLNQVVKDKVMFVSTDIKEDFHKWSDFNGVGPIPMPEALNSLSLALVYYLAEYFTPGVMPELNARTVCRATHRMAFTINMEYVSTIRRGAGHSVEAARHNLNYVGIGWRTPDMEANDWSYLERMLADAPQPESGKGLTFGRSAMLDGYLMAFSRDVQSAIAGSGAVENYARAAGEILTGAPARCVMFLNQLLRPGVGTGGTGMDERRELESSILRPLAEGEELPSESEALSPDIKIGAPIYELSEVPCLEPALEIVRQGDPKLWGATSALLHESAERPYDRACPNGHPARFTKFYRMMLSPVEFELSGDPEKKMTLAERNVQSIGLSRKGAYCSKCLQSVLRPRAAQESNRLGENRTRALDEKKRQITPVVLKKILNLESRRERLKMLRAYLGWTQQELSRRSHVSALTISYSEGNDALKLQDDTVSKLAAAMGIDEDVLRPDWTKEIPDDKLEYVAGLNTVKEKLDYLLDYRKMSMKQLVERSGVSSSQMLVIMHEKVNSTPRANTIRKLADALNINEAVFGTYHIGSTPPDVAQRAMAMSAVGDRLRYLRKDYRGISAERLAELSGITIGHITKIERGQVEEVKEDTLEKLRCALNIEPGILTIDRARTKGQITIDRIIQAGVGYYNATGRVPSWERWAELSLGPGSRIPASYRKYAIAGLKAAGVPLVGNYYYEMRALNREIPERKLRAIAGLSLQAEYYLRNGVDVFKLMEKDKSLVDWMAYWQDKEEELKKHILLIYFKRGQDASVLEVYAVCQEKEGVSAQVIDTLDIDHSTGGLVGMAGITGSTINYILTVQKTIKQGYRSIGVNSYDARFYINHSNYLGLSRMLPNGSEGAPGVEIRQFSGDGEEPRFEIKMPDGSIEEIPLNEHMLPLCSGHTAGRHTYVVYALLFEQTKLAQSGDPDFKPSPFALAHPDFISELRRGQANKIRQAKSKSPPFKSRRDAMFTGLFRNAGQQYDAAKIYTAAEIRTVLGHWQNSVAQLRQSDPKLLRAARRAGLQLLPGPTGSASDPLVAYLNSIEKSVLSEEEAQALHRRMMGGDYTARLELTNRLASIIPDTVRMYLVREELRIYNGVDYYVSAANFALTSFIAAGGLEKWNDISGAGLLDHVRAVITTELKVAKMGYKRDRPWFSVDGEVQNTEGGSFRHDVAADRRKELMGPLEIYDGFSSAEDWIDLEFFELPEKEKVAADLAMFLDGHNLQGMLNDCGIRRCAVYLYGSMSIGGVARKRTADMEDGSNLNILFITDGTNEQNFELLRKLMALLGGNLSQDHDFQIGALPLILIGKDGTFDQARRDGNGFIKLIMDNQLGSYERGLATVEVGSINGYNSRFERSERIAITSRLARYAFHAAGTFFEYGGRRFEEPGNGILVSAYPEDASSFLNAGLNEELARIADTETQMHLDDQMLTAAPTTTTVRERFTRKQEMRTIEAEKKRRGSQDRATGSSVLRPRAAEERKRERDWDWVFADLGHKLRLPDEYVRAAAARDMGAIPTKGNEKLIEQACDMLLLRANDDQSEIVALTAASSFARLAASSPGMAVLNIENINFIIKSRQPLPVKKIVLKTIQGLYRDKLIASGKAKLESGFEGHAIEVLFDFLNSRNSGKGFDNEAEQLAIDAIAAFGVINPYMACETLSFIAYPGAHDGHPSFVESDEMIMPLSPNGRVNAMSHMAGIFERTAIYFRDTYVPGGDEDNFVALGNLFQRIEKCFMRILDDDDDLRFSKLRAVRACALQGLFSISETLARTASGLPDMHRFKLPALTASESCKKQALLIEQKMAAAGKQGNGRAAAALRDLSELKGVVLKLIEPLKSEDEQISINAASELSGLPEFRSNPKLYESLIQTAALALKTRLTKLINKSDENSMIGVACARAIGDLGELCSLGNDVDIGLANALLLPPENYDMAIRKEIIYTIARMREPGYSILVDNVVGALLTSIITAEPQDSETQPWAVRALGKIGRVGLTNDLGMFLRAYDGIKALVDTAELPDTIKLSDTESVSPSRKHPLQVSAELRQQAIEEVVMLFEYAAEQLSDRLTPSGHVTKDIHARISAVAAMADDLSTSLVGILTKSSQQRYAPEPEVREAAAEGLMNVSGLWRDCVQAHKRKIGPRVVADQEKLNSSLAGSLLIIICGIADYGLPEASPDVQEVLLRMVNALGAADRIPMSTLFRLAVSDDADVIREAKLLIRRRGDADAIDKLNRMEAAARVQPMAQTATGQASRANETFTLTQI